jgi:hypothetical protein
MRGVGAEPGGVWALAQGVCVPGAHVYAVPFRVAAALVAACGLSVGFLPWGSSHKGALDRVVLPPYQASNLILFRRLPAKLRARGATCRGVARPRLRHALDHHPHLRGAGGLR